MKDKTVLAVIAIVAIPAIIGLVLVIQSARTGEVTGDMVRITAYQRALQQGAFSGNNILSCFNEC